MIQDVTQNVLLVVTGAGASHGAPRPGVGSTGSLAFSPLTKDLFSDAFLETWAKYEPCIGLADSVLNQMRRSDSSFEEAVAAAAEALAFDPIERDRRTLALRFYLFELFSTITQEFRAPRNRNHLYRALVNRVVNHWAKELQCHVLFVNLNYDMLLEDSLGLTVASANGGDLRAFIASDVYSVIKPHGCVEWVTRIAEGMSDLEYAFARANAIEEAQGELLWQSGLVPGSLFASNQFYRPALSLPRGARKPAMQAPAQHIQHLRSAVKSVRGMLVIGWSAHDDHILHELRPALSDPEQVIAVADPQPEAVLARIDAYRQRTLGLHQWRSALNARDFSHVLGEHDDEEDDDIHGFLPRVRSRFV
jgi:hypothetical protein